MLLIKRKNEIIGIENFLTFKINKNNIVIYTKDETFIFEKIDKIKIFQNSTLIEEIIF